MNFNKVEKYRLTKGAGLYNSEPGDQYGAFQLIGPCGRQLRIIASDADEGVEFEHVSVSTPTKTPNWSEMCFVKDLFWDESQAVMQIHPPKVDYINNHEFCLHMWRPVKVDIPLPPSIAVGYKELNLKVRSEEKSSV